RRRNGPYRSLVLQGRDPQVQGDRTARRPEDKTEGAAGSLTHGGWQVHSKVRIFREASSGSGGATSHRGVVGENETGRISGPCRQLGTAAPLHANLFAEGGVGFDDSALDEHLRRLSVQRLY